MILTEFRESWQYPNMVSLPGVLPNWGQALNTQSSKRAVPGVEPEILLT